MKYKFVLFVHLFIMGNLIFFFNELKLRWICCSVIALIVHCCYFIALIQIDPYQQSLKIHKFTLIFNNALYLLFIFVINLINYIDNLDSIIVLLLAYLVTFCCGIGIMLTFVRLYY
jgi:hypothetical protein